LLPSQRGLATGATVDELADVWSWAVLLYALLDRSLRRLEGEPWPLEEQSMVKVMERGAAESRVLTALRPTV
jgi:hypothetical protein